MLFFREQDPSLLRHLTFGEETEGEKSERGVLAKPDQSSILRRRADLSLNHAVKGKVFFFKERGVASHRRCRLLTFGEEAFGDSEQDSSLFDFSPSVEASTMGFSVS